MGRGDTVQFKTDDKKVGSIYQHQMTSFLVEVLEHLEEHNELPQPDYQDPETGETDGE